MQREHSLTTAGLVLLLLIAQAAQAGRESFERVYPVEPGTRLLVDQVIGSLVILAGDDDTIEIEADFDDSMDLDVRDRGSWFRVELTSDRGLQGYGELRIVAPKWMPVEVNGHQVDVEVEGFESPIEINLVGGDVFVRGGRDEVRVETVHGGIEVHDAIADLDLSSAHEDIELRDCTGDVRIESVNGDVRMEGIDSEAVEVETTQGDILVDAVLAPSGDYYLSTHHGDIAISIQPDANLSITVDTYQGSVDSHVDALMETVEGHRQGKRYRMIMGEGRGRLEIESFNGDVTLYDPKRGRRKGG